MTVAGRIAARLRRAWLERLSEAQLRAMLGRRRGVVVLCYHSLSPDLAGYGYRTAPGAFDGHMALLRDIFDVVPAPEAVAALREARLQARSRPMAVVTFDDGYRDNWQLGTPILERHAIPAGLYAARSLIRDGGGTFLDETGLRRLADHPLWHVGAHGLTHSVMTGLCPADQRREAQLCRDWLAELTGTTPVGFAYPLGDISAAAIEAVRPIYDHAFSTDRRLSSGFDPAQIRRVCPRRQDDAPTAFLRLLWQAPWEDGIKAPGGGSA